MRLSGPRAVPIAGGLLRDAARLAALASHRLTRVALLDPADGAPLDDALVVVMRAPHSYTGEDVVELSCHGSPALLRTVVACLRDGGARLAEPGEFTRRAYLNGRMDLARAEAVALLVSARTERAARLAARALTEFGDAARRVRDTLLDVVAGLEVRLDFPEEGVGLVPVDAAETLAGLARTVDAWRHAARRGRVVHEGLTVALVGAPNAGKSTLLNALVGSERAIVSATPGTTRDVVEATIALGGVPVRLLDTAGLGVPANAIEAEGMRRSRKAIDESDLALCVFDGSAVPDASLLAAAADARTWVRVRAKADLPPHAGALTVADAVAVCALDGRGVDALVRRIEQLIAERVGADGDEGGLVSSLRQLEIFDTLVAALRRGATAVITAPLEVALVDLREALASISDLLGVEVGDAVLDRVFATFCLGK